MVRPSNVNGAILILMPTHKLTAEIINAAIEGFEQQKLRIDGQIAELRQMLHGGPTATAATPDGPKGKQRKLSAAGKARPRAGDFHDGKQLGELLAVKAANIDGGVPVSLPEHTRPACPMKNGCQIGRAHV